jgi:hypothetical protein
MKKLTMMIALFAIAGLFHSAFAQEKQPNLQIEGGFTYDWGDVKPEDSPLKAKIKIMNAGDADLKITNVKPGCGCTTAPLEKDVIPPGGNTFLDVSLRMDNYTGDITKTIMIESNDPNKKRQMLRLKFNVVRPYKLFPRFLSFNRMYLNEESSGRVVINNNTKEPMTITKLEVQPADLKLSIKEGDIIPADNSISIDATYTPTSLEPFQGQVKVSVDNKDVSEPIVIRVWGRVVGNNQKSEN